MFLFFKQLKKYFQTLLWQEFEIAKLSQKREMCLYLKLHPTYILFMYNSLEFIKP